MTNEFWRWWQHIPERLDPVMIEIGVFKLQYYGMMYLVAFGLTYFLVRYRIRHEKGFNLTEAQVESLTTAMIVGVILGGRLGYVFFYNLPYYAQHPLEIFLPFSFEGGIRFTGISGMSYHGGLIGVIAATMLYGRRNRIAFTEIADLYAPAVPLGYTFGRIGNFINGELYGRATELPVGMYFPSAPTPERRHPSQLYEAFFEGIFCFMLLWFLRRRVRTRGAMLALYLISYGTVRFFIEFFREPDAHLGFVLFRFSTGQLLCGLMVLFGIGFYLFRRSMFKNASNFSG
ncbi:prolipoprotein diacylglyceryl transferase [Desulfococcus multivorans]|uniref:Phosphatidylglycerol--prolipoprotein diacylglyceryl transferase n=1 Tax=Desulfococcus multivorans DSM 2059 TaxID=1121405 RepID=S7U3A1_DESML|nr:prolipoprotein diacylglyceryl transferase [Desulfococcus multivorans]AOY59013.1 Lgt: prolipoprotein diacylglyeryl transferase [Desulfococcus multivorans]AQV01275.1 prolipoprotein diacylglyceryl transferase [Desulfococcus multivorans]EPR43762.1 Prolipoprotein diacylglyceryl transferase [Desulfococcus multivorans DSM 2059]SJZ55471.1 phosphatidylglycerol:prolipoprotein diacylglycerol transferase [Desulfococcus multivorans DSM 2059]